MLVLKTLIRGAMHGYAITEFIQQTTDGDPRVSAMQHCQLIKVPKAGHWVHHDQLELFLRETKAFLQQYGA